MGKADFLQGCYEDSKIHNTKALEHWTFRNLSYISFCFQTSKFSIPCDNKVAEKETSRNQYNSLHSALNTELERK